MMPTLIPKLTRREAFRLGALTVSGYGLAPMLAPRNVRAASGAKVRGSADAVIFLNLLGGPSQMDTFDVKEGKWALESRDVRTTKQGYQFPYGLMPKLVDRLDDLVVVRSMEAWETIHSRGQYYLQTGHAVSAARVKEAPSLGAIVAYEMLGRRKESDFLPPFVAMNYEGTTMYGPLIREGCLKSDCAPLTVDLKAGNLPFVVDEQDRARFNRRWELLNRFDTSRRDAGGAPKAMLEFDAFAKSVHRMMDTPQISRIVKLDEAERKAYGETPIGDACLLARNMVAAGAGARFLLLTHGDWDHHANIYGKDGKGGVQQLSKELDAALSALLFDLKRTKRQDGSSLLDRTLVVCMGEFGRFPGELTVQKGREHYAKAMVAAFAGAGVKGGRVIGATDAEASKVVEFGWRRKRPIYTEDVCATIYSALGIDWTKRITNTPSGRDFIYVDPAAGQRVVDFQEVTDLFEA
ncbi:MAG TPA: DUF1501 domain-containing protein [Bryobacteraceae bacterium]|jgi:hypothetical protein|nr:DUF1501 domain-containing protein [Bryobacteraceae bacterium]